MFSRNYKSFSRSILLISISLILTACASNSKDHYQNKSAQEIYDMGRENSDNSNYLKAIKDFEALEARFPYGEYANKAQLALIYSYFKREEMEKAIAAADRFIKLHPKHPEVDYAYYLKAMANYDDNFSLAYRRLPLDRSAREPSQARQSFDDFKLLLEKFPKSKYASDAKQRMLHLKNQLANHEWHVADYYMSKEAYLAAANRASYIVTNFDKTEAVPKALAIMFKAYTALAMPDLAQESFNTLEDNFPESKEFQEISKK